MSTFLAFVAMLLHFGSPVNQPTTVNSSSTKTSSPLSIMWGESPSATSTIRVPNS